MRSDEGLERTLLEEWEDNGGTEEAFYLMRIGTRLNNISSKTNTLVHEIKQTNRALKRIESLLERICVALEEPSIIEFTTEEEPSERLIDEIV